MSQPVSAMPRCSVAHFHAFRDSVTSPIEIPEPVRDMIDIIRERLAPHVGAIFLEKKEKFPEWDAVVCEVRDWQAIFPADTFKETPLLFITQPFADGPFETGIYFPEFELAKGTFKKLYRCYDLYNYESFVVAAMTADEVARRELDIARAIGEDDRMVMAKHIACHVIEEEEENREEICVAMKEYRAGNAWRFMSRGYVPHIRLSQLCLMVHDMITAIERLHARGFAHLDIKPDNFVIDERLVVALADFGLIANLQNLGAQEELRGTIVYLAPEAMSRGPLDLVAMDKWALGMTLLEFLTGSCPWVEEGKRYVDREIEAGRLTVDGGEQGKERLRQETSHVIQRTLQEYTRHWEVMQARIERQIRAVYPEGGDPFVNLINGLLRVDPQARTPLRQASIMFTRDCLANPGSQIANEKVMRISGIWETFASPSRVPPEADAGQAEPDDQEWVG